MHRFPTTCSNLEKKKSTQMSLSRQKLHLLNWLLTQHDLCRKTAKARLKYTLNKTFHVIFRKMSKYITGRKLSIN